MSRHIVKILTATAALGISLAACGGGGGDGGGGSADDATQKKGPITIWYSNNEQELAWG